MRRPERCTRVPDPGKSYLFLFWEVVKIWRRGVVATLKQPEAAHLREPPALLSIRPGCAQGYPTRENHIYFYFSSGQIFYKLRGRRPLYVKMWNLHKGTRPGKIIFIFIFSMCLRHIILGTMCASGTHVTTIFRNRWNTCYLCSEMCAEGTHRTTCACTCVMYNYFRVL